jgi:hypothetical protein
MEQALGSEEEGKKRKHKVRTTGLRENIWRRKLA